MQNNALPHKAHITRHWLQQNNANVIQWPAQSSDLNPHREYLCSAQATSRSKVCNELCGPGSMRVKWGKIDPETFLYCLESMRRRLDAVV